RHHIRARYLVRDSGFFLIFFSPLFIAFICKAPSSQSKNSQNLTTKLISYRFLGKIRLKFKQTNKKNIFFIIRTRQQAQR
ncbi:hypothetical protein ACLK6O_003012, partial [Proteus mirabilis]